MTNKIKYLRAFLAGIAILLTTATFAPTALASGSESDEPFNAGEMIINHVVDNYEIHVADHVVIPLPIILYSDNGLDIFSSGSFYHGDSAYKAGSGNTYMMDHGKIIMIDPAGTKIGEVKSLMGNTEGMATFLDFSITKNVAGMFVSVFLLILVFMTVAKAYKRNPNKAPSGLQNAVEPFILFIRDDIAKASIGHGYQRFVPFLLSIFFFIWFGNMLGLIPFLGGMNITGNIAVALVLALFTFAVTLKNGNKGFYSHIVAPPGVPLWLLPIMLPIEIIGLFSKPIVLTLRLFANITAGHIIILSFISLIFIFKDLNGAGAAYGVSIASLAFAIFMNLMELLVAFLQAYVFTLLSAIYFGQAVEEAH